MAFKFEPLGWTPSFETQWARGVISFLKKSHLDGFNFRLCSLNQLKMICKQWRCSSVICKKMVMSSRQMRPYVRFSFPRQFCINQWKVAGALHSPKGMQSHSKKAKVANGKCSVLLWQFIHLDLPESGLQVEAWKVTTAYQTLQCLFNSQQGVGILFVWVFRWQKSMQKHGLPSFFWTSTTALHHTLWLGWIVPESNISHRCVQTSSTKGRGICLHCSLHEALSVTLITCLVESVQLSF